MCWRKVKTRSRSKFDFLGCQKMWLKRFFRLFPMYLSVVHILMARIMAQLVAMCAILLPKHPCHSFGIWHSCYKCLYSLISTCRIVLITCTGHVPNMFPTRAIIHFHVWLCNYTRGTLIAISDGFLKWGSHAMHSSNG